MAKLWPKINIKEKKILHFHSVLSYSQNPFGTRCRRLRGMPAELDEATPLKYNKMK